MQLKPSLDLSDMNILCYHRIIDDNQVAGLLPDDGLSICAEELERHFLYLKNHFNIIDLKQAASSSLKPGVNDLLITFDDGYKDFVTYVIPLILKYRIPVVVFVTSGFINNNKEFCWWLDLWNSIRSIDRITLELNDVRKSYDLRTFDSKMLCYRDLSNILINMTREEQKVFFISNKLEMSSVKDFMTTDDLRLINLNEFVTIGYHSHYHLNYLKESVSTINDDIREMLSFFEKNSILPQIRLFSFPYGFYKRTFFSDNIPPSFDWYFTLGVQALLTSGKFPVASRINIDNRYGIGRLLINIYLFMIIRRFFSVLRRIIS